ncbi:MAG: SpoIIE family protein phosphatase [bacterium]|nr:SpoIIE family protein phosphatase [bacterium]
MKTENKFPGHRHYCIIFFLCCIFLTISLAGNEWDLKFRQVGPDKGFFQETVNCIYQDRKGFTWFGTYAGAVRYDGYNFITFRHRRTEPAGISHNRVMSFCEDEKGTLWIGTQESLDKFDRSNGTFIHFRTRTKDNTVATSSNISCILAPNNRPGKLWVGTRNGLELFDTKKGTFQLIRKFYDYAELKKKRIYALAESMDGDLWLATNYGLMVYSPKADTVRNFSPDTGTTGRKTIPINAVYASSREAEILWAGSAAGLLKFDVREKKFLSITPDSPTPPLLTNTAISSLAPSPIEPDMLWVTTWGHGLIKLNTVTGKYFAHKTIPGAPYSIGNNNVQSVYQGPSGVVWAGFLLGGLNKADGGRKKFLHFRPGQSSHGGVNENIIWEIFQDKAGNFWLGTGKGLIRFDRKTGTFNPYSNLNSQFHDSTLISSICENPLKPGTLWLGFRLHGVLEFTPATGTKTHYRHNPKSPAPGADSTTPTTGLSSNAISVLLDSTWNPGVLWVGTFQKGLNRLDSTTGNITGYPLHGPGGKSASRILCLAESPTSKSILWVGTIGNGVVEFDTSKGIHHRLENLPFKTVHSFHVSPSNGNRLWLATRNGLYYLSLPGKKISATDILDDFCYALQEDSRGFLWVSTHRGLIKYHPDTGSMHRYDTRDGVQGSQFTKAVCRSAEGEVFFGGYNGFNAFFPAMVKDNPYRPPLVITDFQVYNRHVKVGAPGLSGRPILEKNIMDTESIRLSYKENGFSFHFAALSFLYPERNQYAYRLIGLDKDWNYIGTQRVATYTALPAGSYIFKVKGANCDGVWNETGVTLHLQIKPPWYNTRWAYFFFVIVSVSFFLGLNRVQRLRLVKREREQAEHRRKTNELEEARRIQLSLLPDLLPDVPGLDIAVHMNTATEVGGDYYDFIQSDNGTLVFAVGDATGHGLKAGTMVSIMKGFFHAKAREPNSTDFLNECSSVLKQMHLENLFMALTLVRLKDDTADIVSAGMPPVYLFKPSSGTFQEFLFKTPPLGDFTSFPYQTREVNLESGDTLLLFSDGLPELFNRQEEMFGFKRLKELFTEVAAEKETSSGIIKALLETAKEWLGGKNQDDDITFVVIKKA